MQGDSLEPSTYFCWNCKQDFEIKRLLLFGMQTKQNKTKKKKQLQIKHLLLLLGMPETPEIHDNLRQLGYLFLQQLPKQTNEQTIIQHL